MGSILGGRGGITQKEEIQNDTGARLTLSNRDEHYPHSRLRLIIVHADESGHQSEFRRRETVAPQGDLMEDLLRNFGGFWGNFQKFPPKFSEVAF